MTTASNLRMVADQHQPISSHFSRSAQVSWASTSSTRRAEFHITDQLLLQLLAYPGRWWPCLHNEKVSPRQNATWLGWKVNQTLFEEYGDILGFRLIYMDLWHNIHHRCLRNCKEDGTCWFINATLLGFDGFVSVWRCCMNTTRMLSQHVGISVSSEELRTLNVCSTSSMHFATLLGAFCGQKVHHSFNVK